MWGFAVCLLGAVVGSALGLPPLVATMVFVVIGVIVYLVKLQGSFKPENALRDAGFDTDAASAQDANASDSIRPAKQGNEVICWSSELVDHQSWTQDGDPFKQLVHDGLALTVNIQFGNKATWVYLDCKNQSAKAIGLGKEGFGLVLKTGAQIVALGCTELTNYGKAVTRIMVDAGESHWNIAARSNAAPIPDSAEIVIQANRILAAPIIFRFPFDCEPLKKLDARWRVENSHYAQVADVVTQSFSQSAFLEHFKGHIASTNWTMDDALAMWCALARLALMVAQWDACGGHRARVWRVLRDCDIHLQRHWRMPIKLVFKYQAAVKLTEREAFAAYLACRCAEDGERFMRRYVDRILGVPVAFAVQIKGFPLMDYLSHGTEPQASLALSEAVGVRFFETTSSLLPLLRNSPPLVDLGTDADHTAALIDRTVQCYLEMLKEEGPQATRGKLESELASVEQRVKHDQIAEGYLIAMNEARDAVEEAMNRT